MYFFSHILISRVLYRYFIKEVRLNKWAFAYGNIKPDLPPSCFETRHTLEKTLAVVYEKAYQLTSGNLKPYEFSVKLGEICHFVCDFFCYHHLSDSLHKQIFRHILYEILLHFKMCLLHFQHKINIPPDIKPPNRGIASIIFEMRREYFSNPKSLNKDIDYAYSAAVWTFKEIIFCMKYSFHVPVHSDIKFSSSFQSQGRQL
jgi:hypothetical protein